MPTSEPLMTNSASISGNSNSAWCTGMCIGMTDGWPGKTGSRINNKTVFPGIGISIIKKADKDYRFNFIIITKVLIWGPFSTIVWGYASTGSNNNDKTRWPLWPSLVIPRFSPNKKSVKGTKENTPWPMLQTENNWDYDIYNYSQPWFSVGCKTSMT